MRYFTLLLCVLLCVSCADDRPHQHGPIPQARYHAIHFTVSNTGLMVVNCSINIDPAHGQDRAIAKQLVIDTGDPHTGFFASDQDIDAASSSIANAKLEQWQGSDGRAVKVCRFEPATVTVSDVLTAMPIYATEYDMNNKPEFDGILGMDFLSQFVVQIDYVGRTIYLIER